MYLCVLSMYPKTVAFQPDLPNSLSAVHIYFVLELEKYHWCY